MSKYDHLFEHVEYCNDWIDFNLQGMSPGKIQWSSDDAISHIGVASAQAILAQDLIINSLVGHKPPLSDSEWDGKVGIDKKLSIADLDSDDSWSGWGEGVTIDINQLRDYAVVVMKNTRSFIESNDPADLDMKISTPSGTHTVAEMLDKACEYFTPDSPLGPRDHPAVVPIVSPPTPTAKKKGTLGVVIELLSSGGTSALFKRSPKDSQ